MTLWKTQIAGFIFTAVLGTLFHFVFEWTGGSDIAAAFFPVNESIWEHARLIIWPVLIFTVIEYFVYGRYVQNFAPVRLIALLLGVLVIIAGYYTYTGIIGEDVMVVDIIIFFIAAFVVYWYSYRHLNTLTLCSATARIIGIIGLFILAVLGVVLTFYPPHIPLFQDPITGDYGIPIV